MDLTKALSRFSAAHAEFLGCNYSTGYGLDPERKGPTGLIVFAMSDDVAAQQTLLNAAKETLPSTWEGHPVYVKAMSIPKAFSR